jgi:hypothetical protein
VTDAGKFKSHDEGRANQRCTPGQSPRPQRNLGSLEQSENGGDCAQFDPEHGEQPEPVADKWSTIHRLIPG